MSSANPFDVPLRDPDAQELEHLAKFEAASADTRAAEQVWHAATAALDAARRDLDSLAQTGRAAGLPAAQDRVWDAECDVDDARIALLDKRRIELSQEWPLRGFVADRIRDYCGALATLAAKANAAAAQADNDRLRAEYAWQTAQEAERAVWAEQLNLAEAVKAKRAARVDQLRAG